MNTSSQVFETLYSKSSIGKIIEWKIQVKGFETYSEIVTETGQIDGVKTRHVKQVLKGKNIGKKNETTPFTQAVQEAQSKWNKRKENSVSDKNLLSTTLNIKPMLAQNYK